MVLSSDETAVEKRIAKLVVVFVGGATVAGAALALLSPPDRPLGVALVFATAVAAALRVWRLRTAVLWTSMLVYFVAFVGATVVAIRATKADHGTRPKRGNQILSARAAESYLASRGVRRAESLFVPTGLYLTHMQFSDSNNVDVSGFVWQIVPPGAPASLQPGVVFPEAVDGGYGGMQTAYDVTRPDGTHIYGWHFAVTLRQRFDYAKYPFDQQDVWIRMWHRDFERGAVLVPDFAGYPPWLPARRYGLERQFVYNGWHPVFTGFGYIENTYDSTFGFGAYHPRHPFPELVYTTSLRRLSTAPFVNHLMPLIVVYVLTFAILLFMVKNDDRSFNILAALTGLFFLTLLNHQQINQTASADGVSFLGAASGIMYMTFFGVAANAFAVSRVDVAELEWRDNLIAKLSFLPMTSMTLALVAAHVLA